MLNPAVDRCDYGQLLRPPREHGIDGAPYELDAAIATTYSLNLDALLAVPVSLVLGDTLEGELAGEKIALLEAIGQLNNRVKIFYQRGNIHVPREFNRLFALLEPMLVPIIPVGDGVQAAFSSFHPKIWILRYVKKATKAARHGQSVRYRLIVMSRNLTFDRSWDISACLDGVLNDAARDSDPLTAFVGSLAGHAGEFAPLRSMLKELPRVQWDAPSPFRDPIMLPGGGAHIANPAERFASPIQFGKSVDDLLVVSPFLDSSEQKAIHWLGAKTEGRRYLLSRAEELNAIGAQALEGWDCYSLNDKVVDGEESLQQSDAVTQALHAKLIVARSGSVTQWHLGSANATTAALGSALSDIPRNTEFMLRLTGADQKVGIEALIQSWTGDDGSHLFQSHEFAPLDPSGDGTNEVGLRLIAHRLVSAQWRLAASATESGRYDLVLSTDFALPGSSESQGFEISVGLMCRPGAEWPLQPTMEWPGLALTQLSALVPILIKNPEGTIVETLVVQASLGIEGGDERAAQVMRELVDTPEKFLNYVRLLLDVSSSKRKWLAAESDSKEVADLFGFDGADALFEQLMLAAARNPIQLRRVAELIKRLRALNTPIPSSFLALWGHFAAIADTKK